MWLPADHPVWKLHPGARAAVAREWLNISAYLEKTDSRLAEIENRLAQIEKRLANSQHPDKEEPDRSSEPGDEFLKSLVETFKIDL